MKCDNCRLNFNREDLHVDDSGIVCHECYRVWFTESALSAGIPLDVIEGRAKLTDYFTQEYINQQRGVYGKPKR